MHPSNPRCTTTSIGSLHLAQDQIWEARGRVALAAELLRDNLHTDTCEMYSKDGAPVDYPVLLELPHVLLNLVYTPGPETVAERV